MKNKKAYYFSLDAFIALLIILSVVIFIKPTSVQTSQESNLQEDLLIVLSSLKIGEINNTYAQGLVAGGQVDDPNQSVLEQIGEFYAYEDPEAQNLAKSILDELDLDQNVGLYFGGSQMAISNSSSYEDSENIYTSRQIISGIQRGNSTKGYYSRAFLTSENKVDYFYFGGYVGDGNITVNLGTGVDSVEIEAMFSDDFYLSVNGNSPTFHNVALGEPYETTLTTGFVLGDNNLYFTSNESLYVAGGFIKIVYNDSRILSSSRKFKFSGIQGLVNIYDSFYVPGNLTNMELFLHYNSPYNLFFTIGNQEIYIGNSSTSDIEVNMSDADLSAILDYSTLSEQTIPFRFGLENASYLFNHTVNADVFSVTDLSGSMCDCTDSSWGWWSGYCAWNQVNCETSGSCDAGSTCTGGIYEVKDANRAFIESLLNYTGNQVGLVAYSTDVVTSDSHDLSTDNSSLQSIVDGWDAVGSTCICCGIDEAMNRLVADSDASHFRSMVVMSDGEANRGCTGNYNDHRDALEAINKSCEAYDNYGIRVYAIGFGTGVNETVLQDIADWGHGSYEYGNVSQITAAYQRIATEIIKAAYVEQTVVGEGVYTALYPDSYLSIDYEQNVPYGLLITAETEEFGNNISQGDFFIPNDTIPQEIKVVSYSGSKWTDEVEVYNNATGAWDLIFDLSDYNLSYINLGDPYVVNIPLGNVVDGNNQVRVSTALNSFNASGGSPYNKVIYSLVKNVSAGSTIVASAEGCTWIIEFEDGTNETLNFPSNYTGSSTCSYTSTQVSYNVNDAIDGAIYNLLLDLDLDSDFRVDTKFSENDLAIYSEERVGIRFTWETEVQSRVWN